MGPSIAVFVSVKDSVSEISGAVAIALVDFASGAFVGLLCIVVVVRIDLCEMAGLRQEHELPHQAVSGPSSNLRNVGQ